jgi:hypothetical protein
MYFILLSSDGLKIMERAREEAAKAVKEAAMADTTNNLTTDIAVRYFVFYCLNRISILDRFISLV